MSVEKALSKKRSFFGVDPEDFTNPEEFYKVVNPLIYDMYVKKIKNINRHLLLARKKYKQELLKLVLEVDRNFAKASYDNDFKRAKEFSDFFGCRYYGIDETIYWEEVTRKHKELKENPIFLQLVDEYLEYLLNKDLNPETGIISIINKFRKENALSERYGYAYKDGVYQGKDEDGLYNAVAAKVLDPTETPHIFSHTISEIREKTAGFLPEKILGYYYHRPSVKKCIDLLIYIYELMKQLEKYQAIISRPNDAIYEYIKTNTSWNAIMQKSYWIRLGRDTYKERVHSTINLFMIKPGTKKIYKDDIKYFVRRKDRQFESLYKIKCHMMIITIPDSIEEDSLMEIIDFAHENGTDLKFICESKRVLDKIKYILIERELSSRKESGQLLNQTATSEQKYYIQGNYWLIIDPDYYNSFFVNTPNNKNLWNQYGCHLRNHDEANIDIKTLINICIREYFELKQPREIEKSCFGYWFCYGSSALNAALEKEKKAKIKCKQNVFILMNNFMLPPSND